MLIARFGIEAQLAAILENTVRDLDGGSDMHTCDDHHSLAWPLIIIMAVYGRRWLAWRVRRGWPAGAGCCCCCSSAPGWRGVV